MLLVLVVVRFGGLDLRRRRRRRRPGGLARRRRGEVGLLLPGVEHDGRRGGARVLQVVVVVVQVGGRQVLQLVVVVRVVGRHGRGAPVVRRHHFRDVGSRGAAQSHPAGAGSVVSWGGGSWTADGGYQAGGGGLKGSADQRGEKPPRWVRDHNANQDLTHFH